MMKPGSPRSIFVHLNEEGSLCIGDSIIHLPFLRALRSWAPNADITVFPYRGGVKLLEPIFESYITKAVDEMPSADHGDSFDWVFDLVGEKMKTAMSLRRMARGKFFSTCLKGWMHLPQWPIYHGAHVSNRHLQLLKQATGWLPDAFWPWPIPKAYLELASEILPSGPRYVGIAPGAGNSGRNKRWPIEQYRDLACRLADEGSNPVVFLGPDEVGFEKSFQDIPGVIFPENDERIRQLSSGPVAVVALATRLTAAVTNCCGSGHMFALGSAPLVSLFGPTNYKKFAPFCKRGVCVLPKGEERSRMENIDINDVWAAIEWVADPTADVAELSGHTLLQVSFPSIDMNRPMQL